jgi:NAD-dependent deacetylase
LKSNFFKKKPLQSWKKIKEIFYDSIGDAEPNIAHEILAKMEKRSFLESIITQNIDHLHQSAPATVMFMNCTEHTNNWFAPNATRNTT